MSRVTTYKLKGIATTLNQVTIPAGHTFRVNGILNNSKSTSAIQLPSGTTAQRPGSPQTGYLRYNTDNNIVEIYTGTAWVDYDFAGEAGSGGGDTTVSTRDEYLVYVMDNTGDVRSPNFAPFGTVKESDQSVTATLYSDVDANSDWTVARFTSNIRPYNQWRIARTDPNLGTVLSSLLNNYAQWGSANNATQTVTPLAGSSGFVNETMNFQHNNGGGESHDIVTLGRTGTVWSSGMVWGNIDSTGNYGGILNTPYYHSGSGGGNTGERIYVYLETGPVTPNANDYTNYLTPTGPLGDATTFNWTLSSTSGNSTSSPNNVADAVSRTTTSSWQSYGIQIQGNDSWIQVDLGQGNETSFDYCFVIGYPGDSHNSDQNELQGSNDGSNWTTVSQWKYHNGSSQSDGYLIYNQGNHTYDNTINDVNKWHPINSDVAFRYWRQRGFNHNSTNGYLLIINWALLKKNS